MQVGNFIPNVNTEKNVDLLPIAFNAAVVNRVNKNGDVIDTETAIASYKDFINKPINIKKIIISMVFIAEFETDLFVISGVDKHNDLFKLLSSRHSIQHSLP